MSEAENVDNIFLSVEEAAKLIKSSENTLYVYLCNRGKNGGKTGKRIQRMFMSNLVAGHSLSVINLLNG